MNDRSKPNTFARELDVATRAALAAGAAIMPLYGSGGAVESKLHPDDHAEPVTAADRLANQMIVDTLRAEFPADGILAEESDDETDRLGKDRVWMVDPIDGTSGFIDCNGDFAVQIGLTVAGQSVLGVVFQPATGVMFSAVTGGGSWVWHHGGEPLRTLVSTSTDLHQMRLAASRAHRSPRMNRVVQQLGIREEVQRGSVGVKVGLIVERECDLYVHLSPRTKLWDTCAPEVILREAGGRLTDLFGKPLRYDGEHIQNRNGLVATNGVSHEIVIRRLSPLLIEFGRGPAD
ncbi:MAG: 3'(2'),5'-bisphosphate nucleotidase CysQ [Pyrinomonadaceae bacterium]